MQRNQHSGANPVDEVIIELLRQGPRRKAELEQEVPASNVYHRCLQLMIAGRIVAIHRAPTETVYTLSEAERKKNDTSGNVPKQVSQNDKSPLGGHNVNQ